MSQTSENTALAERKIDHAVADTMGVGKGGITFDNAAQVMEYAKMMAASGSAVPKHLRGQPGACLGILDDAIRLRINPYALARKSYFVNDNLAYEAQVIMALINASPVLKMRPDIKWEGEGPDRRCIVTGTFRDGAVREYRSPRFDDIHPKNSPLWKNDPDQQHSYSALRAFARRWAPEVILGIYDVDELRDAAMTDITPAGAPAKPIARSLDEFAAGGAEKKPPAEETAAKDPEAHQDGGAGGSEEAGPPATAAADLNLDALRRQAIKEALTIADRADLEDEERNEQLEMLRLEIVDQLPAEFVKTLLETAQKVMDKKLPAGAAKKYLAALP